MTKTMTENKQGLQKQQGTAGYSLTQGATNEAFSTIYLYVCIVNISIYIYMCKNTQKQNKSAKQKRLELRRINAIRHEVDMCKNYKRIYRHIYLCKMG